MIERVAVIGLGAMGLPMAMQLIKAGFEVHGVDVQPGNLARFAEAGGIPAASPAAAAARVQAVLVMVVNADQADAVLFGADGVIAAPMLPALVVLSVTMAPERVRGIGERLAARGIPMVDAPVSGGVHGAWDGNLAILAAGPDDACLAAEPLLRALGRQTFRVGAVHGQAAAVKILNQLLCGVHLVAAAEAVALAERAGVEPRALWEFVTAASGMSRMFQDRVPRMLEPQAAVKSAVDIFVKDLGLVLDLGRSVKGATLLAAAAHQVFLMASARGLGQRNDSDVVEVYRDKQ